MFAPSTELTSAFAGVQTNMQFCPKCGSLMRPGKSKEGKPVLKCSCGHEVAAAAAEAYRVKFPIRHSERDFIVVVGENQPPTKRKKPEVDEDERQEMLELMLDHFPEE